MSNQTNATREWVLENIESGSNGSQYDETIINISSEQILNMGDTPVELLPAPDANQYYDIESIILEYTHNSTPYTLVNCNSFTLSYEDFSSRFFIEFLTFENNYTAKVYPLGLATRAITQEFLQSIESANLLITQIPFSLSGSLTMSLGLQEELDPFEDTFSISDGDGTLRAIIKYKVRTFGE
jgi:hypothetical protein